MEDVCRKVASVVAPEKDTSRKRSPSREQVRECIIKLGLVQSLSRTRLHGMSLRISRGLGADSSEQGNYEVFAVTEEMMSRYTVDVPDGPLKGLSVVEGRCRFASTAKGKAVH